jgi:hypothetical protein
VISTRRRNRDQTLTRQVLRELRRTERGFERAASKADALREQRNQAVLAALGAGLTYDEVAQATGLNRSRIGQIARGGR